jgi:hypothetical protein
MGPVHSNTGRKPNANYSDKADNLAEVLERRLVADPQTENPSVDGSIPPPATRYT